MTCRLSPTLRPGPVLALGVALWLQASALQAQPSGDVDDLLRRAFALRQSGRDEEAVPLLERALRARRAPRILAQLSQAEQATGHWIEADIHLREALGAEGDPWIDRNRTALLAAQQVINEHVGDLVIRGGPNGATVQVDGRATATLPMSTPARVRVGRVAIEVAAPGHLPVQRVIEVAAHTTTRDEVWLTAVRAAPPPSEASTVDPSIITPRSPSANDQDVRSSRETHRTFGWVAVVGTAVGLGLGTAGVLLRERSVTRFNAERGCAVSGGIVYGGPSCQTEFNTGVDMGYLSIGGFVAAGVFGVSSAILFLTMPSLREPVRAGALRCTPTLGSASGGASCVFTF